jgi:uncharacterized protein (TIGR02246 family)
LSGIKESANTAGQPEGRWTIAGLRSLAATTTGAQEEKTMRKIVLTILLAISLGSAWAGPEEEALGVLQRWTQAFTASDVDAIVKLYAPDALFFGTGSKTLVTNPADVRTYFEAALLNNRPRTATLDQRVVRVLSERAVAISGMDTVTGVKDGNVLTGKGRVTFVVANRDGTWQIVQFHRSAIPN